MADRLAFDIFANDKASGSFRAVASAASDLAEHLDVTALSGEAASRALGKVGKSSDLTASQSAALARVLKQTGSEEDKLAAKALLASAAVKRLDVSMAESGAEADALAGAGGGGLPGVITPITGLIAAGVVLAPILITVGTGLAAFSAAAYSAVSPVLKAAQATGGLAANMGTLNPQQQAVARSFLDLESAFSQFSKSLQPEVFAVLNDGIGVTKTLLKEVAPVARATGTALDTVVKDIGHGLQSAEWKQFFSWMATNAGPDTLLVAKAVGTLVADLPPLIETLQPVASGLLKVVTVGAQAANVLGEIGQAASIASPSVGDLGANLGALSAAGGGHSGFISFIKEGLLGLNLMSQGAASAGKSSQKAGSSFESMGNDAQTSAAQVTALYLALHKLLDPLTQNIGDAVTFKNDQVGLAAALKKSHDVLGLHTAAQRASSSAAAQAAQDALKLSQDIYTQTGSAQKAIRPLQSLASELKDAGVKGDFARQIMRELAAAIAALKSKTITVSVLGNGAGIVTKQGGGGAIFTPGPNGYTGRASGGYAAGLTVVGERGAELVSLPRGSFVWNHAQTAALLSGHSGGSTAAAVIPRSSGSGGGITIQNLYVTLPHGSTREQGRHFVESILKFEQGSGKSWRS